MGDNLRTFRWTCPLCGRSKRGYYEQGRAVGEVMAKNAIVSHVRSSKDDVHGEHIGYPPTFEREDALEHVSLEDKGRNENVPTP